MLPHDKNASIGTISQNLRLIAIFTRKAQFQAEIYSEKC
jgi:hypothetical protein